MDSQVARIKVYLKAYTFLPAVPCSPWPPHTGAPHSATATDQAVRPWGMLGSQVAAAGVQGTWWQAVPGRLGWLGIPTRATSQLGTKMCQLQCLQPLLCWQVLHSIPLPEGGCWVWEKSQPFQHIPVLNTSLDFCFLPKGKRHMFGKGKQLFASNASQYSCLFSIP